MSVIFSALQIAIFEWVQSGLGSALIVAVAGSGKTFTLVNALKYMTGSVAVCAFNKSIADEISEKVKKVVDATRTDVKAATFHSFGMSAWRKVAPRAQVPKGEAKCQTIAKTLGVPFYLQSFTVKLVSLAKQKAIGVICQIDDHSEWLELVDRFDLDEMLADKNESRPDPMAPVRIEDRVNDGISWAQKVFRESINQGNSVIDFDDMIFLPVFSGVKVQQYDWVLIDEAQDTNNARRLLAKMMLKVGGRLIAVGDPRQAIYGFTGADANSMELIKQEFGCIELPLTTTYRCGKAIVDFARQWVSHIEAHESNPDGRVDYMAYEDFRALNGSELRADDAILCRNTAPLVELAFSLIRNRVPCHVEGRDIGEGLIKLAQKWKVSTVSKLRDRLNSFQEREEAKYKAKSQEMKAQQLADKIDTLRVIMDNLSDDASVSDVVAEINSIFGDTKEGEKSSNLTLSTIHKSKGREWDRVYWFGRDRWQPSPYARQQWQREQEVNLMYVAATRAKLVLVDVEAPPKKEKKEWER